LEFGLAISLAMAVLREHSSSYCHVNFTLLYNQYVWEGHFDTQVYEMYTCTGYAGGI